MQNEKIDKSNMKQVILNFPNQFKKGLEISKDVKIKKPINKVVISGMGGSALAGDLLKLYLKDIAVEISRNYYLTSKVNKKSLVFCISFSGNTEETTASLENAKTKGAQIIVMACGGKLEEIARVEQARPLQFIKLIKESPTFQPRSATGYIFASLVSVLVNSEIIPDKSREVLKMAENLKRLNLENQGKNLAKKLTNKIPIIYASDKFEALAKIWKIKFNENSKTQAFWNYFPELNHNEMVGFSQVTSQKSKVKSPFYIIILRDKDDHLRIQKRMEITAELLKARGLEVTAIDIQGENLLTKIFSTLMLGDWTSYYLALEYKVDPTPVEIVEDFKKRMDE